MFFKRKKIKKEASVSPLKTRFLDWMVDISSNGETKYECIWVEFILLSLLELRNVFSMCNVCLIGRCEVESPNDGSPLDIQPSWDVIGKR